MIGTGGFQIVLKAVASIDHCVFQASVCVNANNVSNYSFLNTHSLMPSLTKCAEQPP